MKIIPALIIAAIFFASCKTVEPDGYTMLSNEFDKQLQKHKRVLLDVRTQAEYDSAHLPGALLVDYKASGFSDKLSRLNKHSTYLLYCRSGNRSQKSLELMKAAGFKKVYHLKGGIEGYNGQVVSKQ